LVNTHHLLLCASPWCPNSVFSGRVDPIPSAVCSTIAGGSPSKPGFYKRRENKTAYGRKQSLDKKGVHVKFHNLVSCLTLQKERTHFKRESTILTLLVWIFSNFINCCCARGTWERFWRSKLEVVPITELCGHDKILLA
jgi:hypothetical protein